MEINQRDLIGDLEVSYVNQNTYEITESGSFKKIIDTRVYFKNGKSKRLDIVMKMIKKVGIIKFKSPSNFQVDYTKKSEVINFYKSFTEWNYQLRVGTLKVKRDIFEVKDNLIFFENEYYLATDYIGKKKINEDGKYLVILYKIPDTFWDNEQKMQHNVFLTISKISEETVFYIKNKDNWKNNLSKVEYINRLDYNHLDSNDLDLLKKNLFELLKSKIQFPFKHNDFTFQIDDLFKRIQIIHRNRTGYIEIDNSYKGENVAFGLKYGAILKINPYFTNQCCYSTQKYIYNDRIDKDLIISLLDEVRIKWDKAIENNATIYG